MQGHSPLIWQAGLHDRNQPQALMADLRTDHAGESGAVMIYRGILALTGDTGAALFAVGGGAPTLALRVWVGMVGAGSRVAVKTCRWI